MNAALAITVCGLFVVIALWHFRMALAPVTGESGGRAQRRRQAAIRSVEQSYGWRRLSALVVCSVGCRHRRLVAARFAEGVLVWLSYGLALGLLLRAIGEFKYVGFFKQVRGSRFAKLDTLVYSPLCLLLGVGVALVALQNGA